MPAMLRSGGTCRTKVELDSYTMYNASATKHAPTVRNAVRSLAHAVKCPCRGASARVVPHQTRPRSCYPNRILQARRNRRATRNYRSCTFETVVGDGEVFQPLTAAYVLSPICRAGCRHVSIIRDLRTLESSNRPQMLRYTEPRWQATQPARS